MHWEGMMSLAHAITQTMQAHGVKSVDIAERLGETQDRATFYRLVNGSTTEPRLGTLIQLCIALETSLSELLELAEVWSSDTPGRAGPDDLRLRQAFGQLRALPAAGKQWAVPLVAALAATLATTDEQRTDDDLALGPLGHTEG